MIMIAGILIMLMSIFGSIAYIHIRIDQTNHRVAALEARAKETK